MCIDSAAKRGDMHKPVGLYPCHNQGGNQVNNKNNEFHSLSTHFDQLFFLPLLFYCSFGYLVRMVKFDATKLAWIMLVVMSSFILVTDRRAINFGHTMMM